MPALLFKIFVPTSDIKSPVDYNEKKTKKGKAERIKAKNFGIENPTEKEAIAYLKIQSSLNRRIKAPSFHAMISCKGNEYSHEELMKYAEEVMNRLGYEDQPMLFYAHSDRANNHVHVVTTRVNKKGKKINDSFEYKRANHILNAIMNRNPKMEFEANLHNARQYRVSIA